MIRAFALMMLITASHASDLGGMSEVYPIKETDFLEWIQQRFADMKQNGAWQKVQQQAHQRATHYRDRPPAVIGLTKAPKTVTRLFDPSIVLDRDLKAHDGRLVAQLGTKINPLQYMTLSKALIFFDGDDLKQIAWVKQQDIELKGRTKLILVSGSLLTAEKAFKKHIYFDQTGAMAKRLQLRHVPSKVQQAGDHLSITEVLV